MIALTMLVVVGGGLVQAEPTAYCREENVRTVDGTIQLARVWETVFGDAFENGLDGWQTENYESKLAIALDAQGATGNCVLVANRGARGDTAFELASAPIAVPGGAQFRFSFAWRANRGLERTSGHKGHYLTELDWLDAAGQAVGPTPFSFGKAGEQWQSSQVTGTVPGNAASLALRFGFDSPDLADGQFLAIDDGKLEVQLEPAVFQPAGRMVSRPFRATGDARRLSWEGDVPAGTRIRLQVAGAPDKDGGPGEWSALLGPEGTEQGFFTQPAALPRAHAGHPWLRYMATLETDEPAKTPTLRSVSIGTIGDGPWSGLDTQPPVVAERSPTRTAEAQPPIWFRLADETGIDPPSLRVWLDGAEITGQVAFAEGRYNYALPGPLKPVSADRAVASWRVNNYQGALAVTRAPRAEGAPLGLHLTREAGEVDTAFRVESPSIPVEPGAKYVLSYWSRHSMDLSGAMNGTGEYSGGVTWLDANDAPVGERAPIDLGTASPDWHRDTAELTAPPGAVSAQIAFGFDQPNLSGGAFLDLAEAALEGPHPTREDNSPNLHRLTVRAADFAGNTLQRDWHMLIRPPRTEGVVTLRDDGVTLIDGQPFFPIGLYAVWKKPFNDNSFDKAFGDLKAAGFNFAHTYSSGRGPDFAEFYAAAARHGIKLYVSSDAGANCLDVDTVLWDVVREEAQPALLAWYLADDTASHVSPGDLQTVSEAIHDVDPAHPTVQADGVGSPPASRYAGYVASTDGFLPELYPIRDDSDRGVPQIIADLTTIRHDLDQQGTHRKAIWAIVQYFQGWGWPRYPTKQELWAMSYLSIIHGATGITWYTYGGWGENHGVTDSPEVWQNICQLAGELSQLQDVLVEPTGPQPEAPKVLAGPETDALGCPSLSALLREHAGKTYLFAANSARADVTATFPVAGGKTVSLPFENRQIAADAAGFQDTFAPYAVHVYVW